MPGAEYGRQLLPGEEAEEPGSPSLSYFSGQSGASSSISNKKLGFSEVISEIIYSVVVLVADVVHVDSILELHDIHFINLRHVRFDFIRKVLS